MGENLRKGKQKWDIGSIFNQSSIMAASDAQAEPVPMWIDNTPVVSDVRFSVVNHGTGHTFSAYGATVDITRHAIESSQSAFETWRRSTPWERRDVLLRAAELLAERRDAIEAIIRVCISPHPLQVYRVADKPWKA
jgi:delta 1-pyrroline-5-carboxylate dehydrogenase